MFNLLPYSVVVTLHIGQHRRSHQSRARGGRPLSRVNGMVCFHPACIIKKPVCASAVRQRTGHSMKHWIYRVSRMNRIILLVTGTRDLAGAVPVRDSPSHFRERTNRLNYTLGGTSFGPPGYPAWRYRARTTMYVQDMALSTWSQSAPSWGAPA